MAIVGTFIGVNTHRDPEIRDLVGARRDATALWAAFSDTFEGLDAKLLVDDDATLENVRARILEQFEKATEEDTLVLSFSGHGTESFGLVCHDTLVQDVPGTTLAMAHLADLFRESKAGHILLILDCCHSGAAPAKVLSTGSASRAGLDPFAKFEGAGRLLLAAAAPGELAWETGGRERHGLLSLAIMQVLCQPGTSIEVGEFCSQIGERVRSAAAAIGQVQAPHHITKVDGGFLLPRLKKGRAYFAHFPLPVDVAVADFRSLQRHGIPADCCLAWEQRFGSSPNPLQLRAINEGRVLQGENILVVAPTGAGKTFAGELAGVRAVSEGRKAVFLLPYKALVNEKYDEFRAFYGPMGLRVIRCTGDYQDQRGDFVRGKYEFALLTYEMFLSLAVQVPSSIAAVGLVVVDEAQFIADARRGIVVELLLSLVKRRRDVQPQLVVLSAVIGALNGFDQWLGAAPIISNDRPVPLVEGVLDRSGCMLCVDEFGQRKEVRLLEEFEIVQRRKETSAQDVLVPLARKLLADEKETLLVFRNARGSTEGAAAYLGKELDPGGAPVIDLEVDAAPSRTTEALHRVLAQGVGFHNSNLAARERRFVEECFRKGALRVLVATSTLAAGVNTPASTVVIVEHAFRGEQDEPFSVATYKNMAGRAGRPGFGVRGTAILLADDRYEREDLFRRYVCATPEPVTSAFADGNISTWVLKLLGQVGDIERSAVSSLLVETYGGYLRTRGSPGWAATTRRQLDALVADLIGNGLLEEVEGKVKLTLVGKACAGSALSLESCIELIRELRHHRVQSPEEFLCLVQVLDEIGGIWTPVAPKDSKEKQLPNALHGRVGWNGLSFVQKIGEPRAYLQAVKRIMILLDWTDGMSIQEIERTYSRPFGGTVAYGDVANAADSVRFFMGSAWSIACMVAPALAVLDVDALLLQLEFGVPKQCLSLLELRRGWGREELLNLGIAGVVTLDDLSRCDMGMLANHVGQAAAEDIKRRLAERA